MSKKKKNTAGNIEIRDGKDLQEEQEETLEKAADSSEEAFLNQEEPETVCNEKDGNIEESDEPGCDTENVSEEPEEGTQDGKPAKKERKLKWAKASADTEQAVSGLELKLQEANDKYARLFAEFDNFRKRSEKEKAQRYDFGAKDMIERILPVIDNFERGLAAVSEDKAEDSFVKGMEMTYKQLLKALEDAGVKPIEAVGQEFNPDFHNAVMHIDDPEFGENIIVEEFQKGYIYKDHVVRYSMVKVAN